MTRLRRTTAAGLALLVVLLADGVPATADETLADARRAFIQTRDTCAFTNALAGARATDEYAPTDALLAYLACDQKQTPAATNEVGYAALPAVVAALKQMDLEAAAAAVERVGDTTAGGVGTWARALVEARSGQDERAAARLLALPNLAAGPDLERASFALALFGAAVPIDDRLLLAATGQTALLEACRTGRVDQIERLARSLAALDRDVGSASLCLTFRALRRLAKYEEADRLVTGPEAIALPEARSCYYLERVIAFWRAGEFQNAQRFVSRVVAPPHYEFLVDAIRRARAAFSSPGHQSPPVHVPSEERHATVLANYVSALGFPTTPDELSAAAAARRLPVWAPSFLRELLEEKGLTVVVAAGSARAAEAVLKLGRPFLLHRIRLEDNAFEDVPVLVRAYDADIGVWITDEVDLRSLDALPVDAPRKSWFVMAVPRATCPPLGSWVDPRDQQLGRAIETALDLAAQGNLAGAAGYLDSQAPNLESAGAYHLYRAFLLHKRYVETQDPRFLHLTLDAVERSRLTLPVLPFEHVARGQGLWYARVPEQQAEAVEELGLAQQERPDSAWLARARFLWLGELGRLDQATHALESARYLDPRDTTALFWRGRMRWTNGDSAGALTDLRRAFDRTPTVHGIAMELARVEWELGNPAASRDVLERYATLDPSAAARDDVRRARLAADTRLVDGAADAAALQAFVSSPISDVRRRVVYALARFETPEAERVLRGLLDDGYYAVRASALKVYMRPWSRLYLERDVALWTRTVALLCEDENEIVRAAAAGLIGLARRPEAVAALVPRLLGPERDASPYVRSEVAEALRRHDTLDARRALVDALGDEDRGVRHAVIEALFKLADTYFGYDPDAPPEDRKKAEVRWREWLDPDGR